MLFFLAFLPRLVALGRYVTPDEAIWVYRSLQFREALLAGGWADTLVAGHPGVTTTWLGTLGMSVQLLIDPAARAAYDWLTRMAYLTPDNVEAFRRLAVLLTGGRVAVALVNALGVVGVYWLAGKLWGTRVAVVAGVLLALDPFVAGLSGLLHVDGLSATFATLSLLALLVGLRPETGEETGRRAYRWMAAAGAAAGLAALSKSPLLLLLPVSGLAMLWPLVRGRQRAASARLRRLLWGALIWGGAFALTVVLLYPALWAAPGAVLATTGGSANRHLDEALRETFFLGRAAFDHGPLFYPVVLLWRLSPVVWLALIPAVWGIIRWQRRGGARGDVWLPVGVLLLWAVLFVVAITPAAKKFDRYILPIVPALLLLASVAWVGWAARRPGGGRWVIVVVVAAQGVFWLVYAAYPLSAYNPLVGGPRTAAHVLPAGWGEGIGAAGRRLAQTQPEAAEARAVAGIAPSLAPFFPGRTLVAGLDDAATADYVIVTLGGRQLAPAAVAAQTAGLELLAIERFGGLDQAWTYRNPSPLPPAEPPFLEEEVRFGDRFALTAYGHRIEGDGIEIGLRWRRMVPMSADERYTLRITVRDAAGNIWAATETEVLNDVYHFPADWEPAETGTVRHRLELPPGIPPATYQVMISVIDLSTAAQLPARTASGTFLGVAYDAGTIDVPVPETVVTATRMRIPVPDGMTWLEGRLQLLGSGETAAEALAGSRLPVELFWHVPSGTLPPGIELRWYVTGADDERQLIYAESLSRHDTGLWRTGESIHERYAVPLPPDLVPGDYTLAIQPVVPGEQPVVEPHILSELTINNITRVYELPADVALPLDARWEPLTLAGMSPAELSAAPGESPEVTLYWMKHDAHGEVYSIFVHVLDKNGQIVAQADHWPGGLPTDILAAGQVVTDRFTLPLPTELPPGDYRLRVGMYLSESGARLPVLGGDLLSDDPAVGDSVLLPVTLRVAQP